MSRKNTYKTYRHTITSMKLIHWEREREESDDNIDMKATSSCTTCKVMIRGPTIKLTQKQLKMKDRKRAKSWNLPYYLHQANYYTKFLFNPKFVIFFCNVSWKIGSTLLLTLNQFLYLLLFCRNSDLFKDFVGISSCTCIWESLSL